MIDCRKCVYLSMQDAKKAADGSRLNPYKCPSCGNFHLTSWTRTEWKREVKRRRKAIKLKQREKKNDHQTN